jgi:hypothetical protein
MILSLSLIPVPIVIFIVIVIVNEMPLSSPASRTSRPRVLEARDPRLQNTHTYM